MAMTTILTAREFNPDTGRAKRAARAGPGSSRRDFASSGVALLAPWK